MRECERKLYDDGVMVMLCWWIDKDKDVMKITMI